MDIGNVDSIIGKNGTPVEGWFFRYLYRRGPDSFVDSVVSNGATVLFSDQSGIDRIFYYRDSAKNYRAIYSSIIFGALRDGIFGKNQLMTIYLDSLLRPILLEKDLKNLSNIKQHGGKNANN